MPTSSSAADAPGVIDHRELSLALHVLVRETRAALDDIRPVIEALYSGCETAPATTQHAVARLDAVEGVLHQAAAVYRRHAPLQTQLEPDAFAALVRGLDAFQIDTDLATLPPARSAQELEITLRVLVHEVGNALTSVKPLVDILHRNPAYLWGLAPAQRTAGARVALERLTDTAQVLAQVGDLRPRLERVQLAALIAALQRGEPAWPLLAVACEPGLCVQADALWLRHCLRNLIDNAVRATPPGAAVEIDAQARGAWVALSVRDGGPGLSQEELDYIFHADLAARTQLRRPLAINGAGIGLSLVRYWMHAMGGRIEASAAQLGGTQVTLLLLGALEPAL